MLAKAKLASSITFIVLASFTIVTYDRQNMFIIQATVAFYINTIKSFMIQAPGSRNCRQSYPKFSKLKKKFKKIFEV
jgi:hypothetical protein